ncbi:FAD-dependent thymidylate synthase [Acetobacter pasteurianus]|uniref:Flavin-dependent thymidylate synthase n=2 Tax=Acetobacter pasteurianus TaxID=438 RepID=A0A401WYE5_ACEPA|nr:thymidylate synthase ThyX [Acetobacter pasteurianus NBRC 3188]
MTSNTNSTNSEENSPNYPSTNSKSNNEKTQIPNGGLIASPHGQNDCIQGQEQSWGSMLGTGEMVVNGATVDLHRSNKDVSVPVKVPVNCANGLEVMKSMGLVPIDNDDFKTLDRPHVQELDDILGLAWPALDHGFVRLIDYMGDQEAIIQAARVSYGKGTKSVTEDTSLLHYLYRNRHSSPFEMCEIKLHVKLPIFIARQWIRHRTASVNEYSARYSLLDNEFYLPTADKVACQSTDNKQGRGDVLPLDKALEVIKILREDAERNYADYEKLLAPEDQKGFDVARELGRINLTLNTYTQWYWKVDLHNLLHFLSLRIDSHAQYEIRVYAQIISKILKLWVPDVFEAWEEYSLQAKTFSKSQIAVLRKILAFAQKAGLSEQELTQYLQIQGVKGREAREFKDLLIG